MLLSIGLLLAVITPFVSRRRASRDLVDLLCALLALGNFLASLVVGALMTVRWPMVAAYASASVASVMCLVCRRREQGAELDIHPSRQCATSAAVLQVTSSEQTPDASFHHGSQIDIVDAIYPCELMPPSRFLRPPQPPPSFDAVLPGQCLETDTHREKQGQWSANKLFTCVGAESAHDACSDVVVDRVLQHRCGEQPCLVKEYYSGSGM